ncbi:peptidase C56 [Bordetella genomosp. 9]|uniref:Peptidase C56 n=1 Tax=Bordetella genomosp. 9 TaxID=1416803 RepID=A0A261RHU6_9BORD|nr:type 1 glutamine amidotransferase domain-containing protein [Bordetella genomosp. 9]OZI23883.1 peptidase C56 [Bordetella genomosp. 9]
MKPIQSRRVLMMATHGYEESELFDVRQALLDAGAKVSLASPSRTPITGVVWDEQAGASKDSTRAITPDHLLEDVTVDDYDALVLPGGLSNPDTLRMVPAAVEIVKRFIDEDKTVAAICHAPWMLVEADVLQGRRATGWYSLRRDMSNAGATVVDEPVVVDGRLITSRMPADIPAFAAAIVTALDA